MSALRKIKGGDSLAFWHTLIWTRHFKGLSAKLISDQITLKESCFLSHVQDLYEAFKKSGMDFPSSSSKTAG